jgi:hypothetical protein
LAARRPMRLFCRGRRAASSIKRVCVRPATAGEAGTGDRLGGDRSWRNPGAGERMRSAVKGMPNLFSSQHAHSLFGNKR